MKELFITIVLVCSWTLVSIAQISISKEVITTGGNEHQNATLRLSETIGEIGTEILTNGNSAIQSGFQNMDKCPSNGEIFGCNFVCAGDTNIVYTYGAKFSGAVAGYSWSLSSTDGTIILNTNESAIQVKFLNTNILKDSVVIRVIPTNACSDDTTKFTVYLDDDGVFPGDVDGDGEVVWMKDAPALMVASLKYADYLNNNPTYNFPTRDIPCTDSITTKYQYDAHAAFNAAFNINNASLTNAKHADCNGDGVIDYAASPLFYGEIPLYLPPINGNPKDLDILMRHAYLNVPDHEGNNLKNNKNNGSVNHGLKFNFHNDSILTSGDELRLVLELGSLAQPIQNVQSIGLIVEFSMGAYFNPQLVKDNSHFSSVPWDVPLSANYPVLTRDTDRRLWYIVIGKNSLTGVDFAGDEVCKIFCVVTVDQVAFKNAGLDTIPLDISILEAGVVFDDGTTAEITDNETQTLQVVDNVSVAPKVFLQGAFNASEGLMRDSLRSKNLIPTTEPFTDMATFTHVPNRIDLIHDNRERIVDDAVLQKTGDSAVIDWVFVEVRSDNNVDSVISTRAALLLRNGSIVEVDGRSSVELYGVPPQNAYIKISHRNHLGVVTANPIALKKAAKTVDFTTGSLATYGNNAQKTVGAYQVLWAGDANNDGTIKYNGASNDKNKILFDVGLLTPNNVLNTYNVNDLNLDGFVKYNGASNDKNIILFNVGLLTPNNTIIAPK
ncbi:MAG: hypothetical protein AB8G11_10790 [Saprospiraceae bacterium]